MVDKISALDDGYTIGDLSFYPETYDDKADLYVATNNAETTLKQALPYNGRKIIVKSGANFPSKGILRIGTAAGQVGSHELVYYESKNGDVFEDLKRGYNQTRQNRWVAGTPVTSGVMSDHHNTLRDAVYNIEANLGTKENPTEGSLNYLLKALEEKWLAPRPIFRACPFVVGPPPLTVRFQNFTLAHSVRYLWDFGDGTNSTEKNPIHTYRAEGHYTVRLDVITKLGGTGIAKKYGYIIVENDQITPFFYVLADVNTPGNYSMDTALAESERTGTFVSPTKFNFVDQTDGRISERYWIWDDGETTVVKDPQVHTASHYYQKPGTYDPSLLVILSSTTLKRSFLQKKIVVN